MPNGTVKWFDQKKGYGFISYGQGADVFVHYSSFSEEGMRTLSEGANVSFEIVDGEKGPRADKVTLVPNSSD